MSQPAVSVKGLSKSFFVEKSGVVKTIRHFFSLEKTKIIVLEDVSFSLKKGDRIALIGPSSAGKSTLLKILARVLTPTLGEINTHNLKVGMVLGGQTQLSYHLTVLESLDLFALLYAVPKEEHQKRIRELTELCGQTHDLLKQAGTLSLEKRVLFDLILGLIPKPEILLLDDPMRGLEAQSKEKVKTFLQEVCVKWGITLILATQDSNEIDPLCQRVFLLDKGALLKNTSAKEWKNLLSKRGVLSLLVKESHVSLAIPGVEILENDSHRFRCELDLDKTSLEEILSRVLKQTRVQTISFEAPNIEKIIQAMYGRKTHV